MAQFDDSAVERHLAFFMIRGVGKTWKTNVLAALSGCRFARRRREGN
jgi:hypothetical protein